MRIRQKLKTIFRNENLRIFLFTLVLLVPYLRLFNGFFQQDEWYGFTDYVLLTGKDLPNLLATLFSPSIGHYDPLSDLVIYVLYNTWGMNYQAFLLVSLTSHLIIINLVYRLAKRIFSNKQKPAILATAFFTLFASSYQGTAWVVANIGTHGATIFGLLSTISFFDFLMSNKQSSRKFYLAIGLFFVSLLFKEITFGLFVVYFFACFLFGTKNKKNRGRYLTLLVTFCLVYIFARILMFFAPHEPASQFVTQTQSLGKLVYNFGMIPFKSISQSTVPVGLIRLVADQVALVFPDTLTGGFGSPQFEVFVVKRVMEMISLGLAVLILLTGLVFFVKKRKSPIILFSFLWIIVNSVIFAFSPERSGVVFTVDSRNLYFISIGSAIVVAYFLTNFYTNKVWVTTAITVILFGANIFWLNCELIIFTQRGKIRREILQQIKNRYPDLPMKTLFYIQSDKSYYGLPEDQKILPFQSGLGQTLLVWYYPQEKFSKEFFKDRFLWEIEAQGYKEVGEVGFGFVREPLLLYEMKEKYNLPADAIIAFKWISRTEELVDITPEVRLELDK
ncbi:MAG: hypothetical protein AAB546_03305 [Patescibacteria group bacterium]